MRYLTGADHGVVIIVSIHNNIVGSMIALRYFPCSSAVCFDDRISYTKTTSRSDLIARQRMTRRRCFQVDEKQVSSVTNDVASDRSSLNSRRSSVTPGNDVSRLLLRFELMID